MLRLSSGMQRVAPIFTRAHVLYSSRTASSSAPVAKHVERQLTPQEVYDREDKYGAHNYHPLPVALERGEGECHIIPMIPGVKKLMGKLLWVRHIIVIITITQTNIA